MEQRPGFDVGRMSTAAKILLGASLLFVIDSFLPWNRVCFGGGELFGTAIPETCASATLWEGIGILAALLAIALLALEAIRAAGVNLGTVPPRTLSLASAGLAAGVVLFTLIKILVDNEALSYGAWIGIILALAIGYGGWMRWQETKAAIPPPTAPPPGGTGFST